MKRLALLGALWFAASGVSAIATAADKAMEDKKAPTATKPASETKPATKDTSGGTQSRWSNGQYQHRV